MHETDCRTCVHGIVQRGNFSSFEVSGKYINGLPTSQWTSCDDASMATLQTRAGRFQMFWIWANKEKPRPTWRTERQSARPACRRVPRHCCRCGTLRGSTFGTRQLSHPCSPRRPRRRARCREHRRGQCCGRGLLGRAALANLSNKRHSLSQ